VISPGFDTTEHESDCSQNNKKSICWEHMPETRHGRKNWILSAWTSVNLRNPSIKYNPRGIEKAEAKSPTWTPCIYIRAIAGTNLLPEVNKRIMWISISENYIRICSFLSNPLLFTSPSYYIGEVYRAVSSLGKNFSELRLRTISPRASEKTRKQ